MEVIFRDTCHMIKDIEIWGNSKRTALTELVLKSWGISGLSFLSTTALFISSMDGLEETIPSNGGW